jgi:RND family efflux transporter MFP subunit
MIRWLALGCLALGLNPAASWAQDEDEKAVFATVESVDVIAARSRVSGTIGELRVDEGDRVEAGQVIAVVVDEQISPQIGSLNAQVAALAAQLDQARADLARDQSLFDRGLVADARLEAARTQVQVLENQVASARQQRAVAVQRSREGDVEAPAAGVVLRVPVTAGTVVMPGEQIAEIASELYVLRLSLPERHARFIAEGDPVRVAGTALGEGALDATGMIRQVYPRIEAGRVTADAVVEGLGDYFVGERVRVLIEADPRTAILIPERYRNPVRPRLCPRRGRPWRRPGRGCAARRPHRRRRRGSGGNPVRPGSRR